LEAADRYITLPQFTVPKDNSRKPAMPDKNELSLQSIIRKFELDPVSGSKYPPAEPGALGIGPLEAAV